MEHVIKLDYPFEFGEGEQITQITIRRPKVKDVRKLNIKKLESSFEEQISFLQTLIKENNSNAFIDRMDFSDLAKALEVVESFLPDTPAIGETA